MEEDLSSTNASLASALSVFESTAASSSSSLPLLEPEALLVAVNKGMKMDDLLPQEIWTSCLEFVTSSKIIGGTKRYSQEKQCWEQDVLELGPLPLRATCTLFSLLCLELITDINIASRKDGFSMRLLVQVLLARPRRLKSIRLSTSFYSVFVEPLPLQMDDLLIKLATALNLEKLHLLEGDESLQGPLICAIGERCTKLKELTLEVYSIDGAFDSPTAFASLESLSLEVTSFIDAAKEDRDAIEPPDFKHFKRLLSVEHVLLNVKWAMALSDAPRLKSIRDGYNGGDHCLWLSDDEFRAFFAACKGKPIASSITSIELSDYINPEIFLDATAIALFDTFPMLERVELCTLGIALGASFVAKLGSMQHLKELELEPGSAWCPTRTWLGESCSLFPKSLTKLSLKYWDWDGLEEEDRDDQHYIQYIEISFRSVLNDLVDVQFDCM